MEPSPEQAHERRFLSLDRAPIRMDARDGDEPARIRGLASVFYDGTPDTEFELWSGVVERIMPGAFDRAIEEEQDVVGLFNHDANLVLGRRPLTLSLRVTAEGLAYSILPPKTRADTVESIERGDVIGSSFSFRIQSETWRKEDGLEIREILDVDLFDVGPVTFPAYETTTTSVRSLERFRERRQQQQNDGLGALELRLRLAERQ